MADVPAQRRRYPRYSTETDLTVYAGGKSLRARITQVSRGGCLIYPPLALEQGNDLRLSFQLSDGLSPINCKGEIVYNIQSLGTGIAFTEISIYNQDRITEFFRSQGKAEIPAGS